MPEETYSAEMEIFAEGNWNGDAYTAADLQGIADNFNELKDTLKPGLKLGHRDLKGQPSLGLIDSLKVQGQKLVASVKDIPKIVHDAIQRKLYRNVSSELYQDYESNGKRYPLALKAVALLGSDIPAVNSLDDLQAYFAQEGVRSVCFELDAKDASKLKKPEVSNMGDETAIKEFEKQIADKDAAIAAEKTAREAAETKLKEFEQKQADGEKAAKLAEVREFCESAVKAGKLTPALRDKILPKEGNVLVFSETERTFSLPFATFKEVFEGMKVLAFDEKGNVIDPDKKNQAENTGAEVDKRAKALVSESKVKTYSEAVRKVLQDDPQLAKDYMNCTGF